MLLFIQSINLIATIGVLILLIKGKDSKNLEVNQEKEDEGWNSLNINEFRRRVDELQAEGLLETSTEIITPEQELELESRLGIR